MWIYFGGGKTSAQVGNELDESFFLPQCTCVGRAAGIIKASYVADAYGVGVMMQAMGTLLSLRAAGMKASVEVYNPVITDGAESALAVPAAYVGYCEVAPGSGGAAVDYDFGDLSHVNV